MTSKQRQIALAFLDTFESLDYEANLALRTIDCRHSFAPASLGIGEKSNEQFESHLKSLQKTIEGIPVTAKQIFEGNNQITVWATSDTKFKAVAKARDPDLDWTYQGEYIFIFTFNDAGDKIQHILEFLDSKKVEEARRLFRVSEGTLAHKKASQ
ncbi:hypothetical protein, variant [Phialophora macrospora]|uniref:SnoaL-like domain-containing protein n=1 Tax=Phialophora macrospora TaxID=1851006 RepID=A0A0D2EEF2_9EURO|nr:hypothetical protein PV04_00860 [Phialophora macrospora]KIW72683.1 hypothetical protein, variant [Phialophora macrospora]